jgi:hypothetical protein
VCFVLSSPWTINLCAALRDLVHEDNNGNGNDNDNGNDCNDEGGFSAAAQYRAVLKGRLTEMGKLLLDQVLPFSRSHPSIIRERELGQIADAKALVDLESHPPRQ